MKERLVQLSNNGGFKRRYRNPDSGEVLVLYPGLNACSGKIVEAMQRHDPRFAAQLADGSITREKANVFDSLVAAVREGKSVQEIEHSRDAIAVAKAIDDIKTLMRMYRECRRVSVRSEIVAQLRRLGYEGN